MGLFDKIKKLSSNLSAEKIQGKMNSVNTEDITTKITSVNDSLVDKMESKIENIEEGAAEDITTKIFSATDSMTDKMTSKFENDDDDDDEEEDDDEYDDDDKEDYDEDDEEEYDDEELKARKKERNKKVVKGFAKGAMFVGSFLYAQKEGADSGSSLLHAFNKTKEVDDLFEGKKKEGKKDKDKDKDKDKEQSKGKQIRSIARYQYICPKNNRGHNIDVPDIDIPTTDGSGCPSREEAVEAIMRATGVDKALAQGIWNGGATNAWRKVSYTYVNDGKRGGTVKC